MSILATIMRFFAKAFGQALADIFSAWRNDQAHRSLGAAEAQIQLDKEVKEVADAQAENNAADRGRAADVLGRLQDSVRRAAG